MRTLSVEEVIGIHRAVSLDFANTDDPIFPSGVKSLALLESAVARQTSGFDGALRYATPIQNAATLAFGICMNHPFHNGNKRTSLVSLLCHMDGNDYKFDDEVSQQALYEFMMKMARHEFRDGGESGKDEIDAIAQWIRKRARKIERSERLISYRELTTILAAYGVELDNHHDNAVDVVKSVDESTWFGLRTNKKRVKIMRLIYPSDGREVPRNVVRKIREKCGLTDADGIDSVSFYARGHPIDYFVHKYRKTIDRLART